ncbi:MAG: ParA family protein [Candidatus Kapaibacteriota bacterium]|jgi:chromosome partitioning protein
MPKTATKKAKIIAIVNNKGGVGKTTATVHIGHALAQLGYKVLCVDMDDQANLVQYFFGRRRVNDLKKQQNGIPLPIQHHDSHVDILMLSSFDAKKEEFVRVIHQSSEGYDFVLLDSPPALEMRTHAALEAATGVLIPTEAGPLAYSGTTNLINLVVEYNLDLYGVFVNMYEKKLATQRAYLEQYEVNYADQFIPFRINRSALFTNSVADAKTGFQAQGKKPQADLESYMGIAKIIAGGKNG